MSQGDCNAPSTMMEAMLDIFKNMVYQYLVIYINNIIIYSRTYEEHERDLKKVLQQLEEQKFYLKECKYQFCTRKLEILLHILTWDGLHVDSKKRKTILEFPTSTRKKRIFRSGKLLTTIPTKTRFRHKHPVRTTRGIHQIDFNRHPWSSFQATEGTCEFFTDLETLQQLVQRTEISNMWS